MNSECELIYIDKYYIICKLLKKLKIIIRIILIKKLCVEIRVYVLVSVYGRFFGGKLDDLMCKKGKVVWYD